MGIYPFNPTEECRDFRHLLARSAKLYPSHTAFCEKRGRETVSVSYAEFWQQTQALGTAFLEAGFAGCRVGLVGENSIDWIRAYFALTCIGSVVVPLDKDLSEEEMTGLLKNVQAAAVIHSETFEEEAAEAAQALGISAIRMHARRRENHLRALMEKGAALLEHGDSRFDKVTLRPEDLSVILFTSGTTGTSKGVMLSVRNQLVNTRAACDSMLFTAEDTLLSVLPLHHAYEQVCSIFGPVYYGCRIAFCPGIKNIPGCLAEFGPTIMILVPLYLETFAKRIADGAKKQHKERSLRFAMALGRGLKKIGIDVRKKLCRQPREALGGRLKLIVSGSAPLDPQLIRFYAGLGVQVLEGYGISECAPLVSTNRQKDWKAGTVGRPASWAQVCTDEDGQILVKGDCVMLGYWQDEAATKAAIDEDGWFATGDLGGLDKQGYLCIRGRSKDIIVLKNGKNIMPQEIERRLLRESIVAETVVVGTSAGKNGIDSLHAVIYPDPQQTAGMEEEEIRALVSRAVEAANRGVIYYKQVQSFSLRREEFEKTTTRKIKRHLVREETCWKK
ncbi:MAG: AMP-binding protein [Christensenellaceae bacterium]|nr:AMP-binding protein [Christensenellaceae bacterium]